ncbi:MAG TPA: hypothetical protein VK629_22075 [Steroidobacteraceae bacterium]|nr:hypothetical protein [Steroidobacteraceae bacterium]
MDEPTWFKQLKWSKAVHIAELNASRPRQIPDFTGCYAFTEGCIALAPGRVLYVGEAARQTLKRRIPVYLEDIRSNLRTTPSAIAGHQKRKEHKGKGFVLEMRDKLGDAGVYVRWVEYGASEQEIHILEASLISYLNPLANDRVEEARHPLLGDDEQLNRRLLR